MIRGAQYFNAGLSNPRAPRIQLKVNHLSPKPRTLNPEREAYE